MGAHPGHYYDCFELKQSGRLYGAGFEQECCLDLEFQWPDKPRKQQQLQYD